MDHRQEKILWELVWPLVMRIKRDRILDATDFKAAEDISNQLAQELFAGRMPLEREAIAKWKRRVSNGEPPDDDVRWRNAAEGLKDKNSTIPIDVEMTGDAKRLMEQCAAKEEREFNLWHDYILDRLSDGKDVDATIATANAVLAAYRAQFCNNG